MRRVFLRSPSMFKMNIWKCIDWHILAGRYSTKQYQQTNHQFALCSKIDTLWYHLFPTSRSVCGSIYDPCYIDTNEAFQGTLSLSKKIFPLYRQIFRIALYLQLFVITTLLSFLRWAENVSTYTFAFYIRELSREKTFIICTFKGYNQKSWPFHCIV